MVVKTNSTCLTFKHMLCATPEWHMPFLSRHMLFLVMRLTHSSCPGSFYVFTSLKTEQRILLNLCSIRVLLPKSLRSSSYVVCLSLKPNRTARSCTFSSFSAELVLQKCQVVHSSRNVVSLLKEVNFSWAFELQLVEILFYRYQRLAFRISTYRQQ